MTKTNKMNIVPFSPKVKNKKYILKRAKNGKKREKHVSAAMYAVDKNKLRKEADDYARRYLGYQTMSISAYINIKLLTS